MSEPLSESDVTSSGVNFSFEDVDSDEPFDFFKDATPADIIDGEIVSERPSRLKDHTPDVPAERRAKSTAPDVTEWMDFFSKVLIRGATDFYIDHVFREIDEDLLSDREVSRIQLNKEERDRIARPFAELSTKLKFTKKHGRSIIATAGSIDSAIQLGMWFSRVNRIASKYKRLTGKMPSRRSPMPSPVMRDGGNSNVSSGPDTQAGSGNGHRVRPPIIGEVFNPDRA